MRTKTENLLPKTAPGAVCEQMVRCGKHNCKCRRGELHGPYFYHFMRVDGVLVKRYVKANDVALMRAACEARRQEARQNRLVNKFNVRELMKVIEQLRENENLLFQCKEISHG